MHGIICLHMSTKSDNIRATLQATKERRKSQTCHVYEIKVDKARLSASQRLSLAQLFREAKWFWNAALASESFFDFDTSVKEVSFGYETCNARWNLLSLLRRSTM